MTGYAPEINLTNLHSKSLQEVYDFIVAHLMKQGKRSVNETGTCVYRGPKGLMCAVGCLIPDEDYRIDFEGAISRTVIERMVGFVALVGFVAYGNEPDKHMVEMDNLLRTMQMIHDSREVDDWEESFRRCAHQFKIEYKEKD